MKRVIENATEPKTTLTALTAVSCLGAAMYLALVFTGADMEPLYFSLIVLMCVIGIASLYILRTSVQLATIVYSWLAGTCLASMMVYDALRGKRFDHLLWMYVIGVVYIIIHVNNEHGFFYALGSAFVGALLGLCDERPFDAVFYALMPLATWLISAPVANIIRHLRQQTSDLETMLETWENAERGRG